MLGGREVGVFKDVFVVGNIEIYDVSLDVLGLHEVAVPSRVLLTEVFKDLSRFVTDMLYFLGRGSLPHFEL